MLVHRIDKNREFMDDSGYFDCMHEHYLSKSEKDTIDIARKLAEKTTTPSVICLNGTLGAGKSVFARAFIRHLCCNESLEVPSPTFTLVQVYDEAEIPIYHFDLYRIQNPDELYELGWEEALDHAITIIEWPERLGYLKPQDITDVLIKPSDDQKNHRKIEVRTS